VLTKKERQKAQEILDMMQGFTLQFNETFTTYRKEQVEALLDHLTEDKDTPIEGKGGYDN